MQGQEGIISGSIIAFSGDSGSKWFFLEGSHQGKTAIANDSPTLLQQINIPAPTLQLGDVLFIQQNGQWLKQ